MMTSSVAEVKSSFMSSMAPTTAGRLSFASGNDISWRNYQRKSHVANFASSRNRSTDPNHLWCAVKNDSILTLSPAIQWRPFRNWRPFPDSFNSNKNRWMNPVLKLLRNNCNNWKLSLQCKCNNIISFNCRTISSTFSGHILI